MNTNFGGRPPRRAPIQAFDTNASTRFSKSGSGLRASIIGTPRSLPHSKEKAPGGFSPLRRWFLWGSELSGTLLHADRKRDTRAVGQVDAERLSVARGQVGGGHVKVPL